MYPKVTPRAPIVKPAPVATKPLPVPIPKRVVKEKVLVKPQVKVDPVTVVGVPADSVLAELFSKPLPPVLSQEAQMCETIPVATLGFDLDTSAAKVAKLTQRDREIIEGVLENNEIVGLTKGSLYARVSGLCSRLDIPVTNRFESYDRRKALKLIWNRYKQLVSEEKLHPKEILPLASRVPQPISPKIQSPVGRRLAMERQERELLSLFRQKTLEERALILEYAKSLSSRR